MRRTVVVLCSAAVMLALLPAAVARAASPVSLGLSPVVDTREVGSTLTATVRAVDGSGSVSPNVIVDMHVTGGPSVASDLDGNPSTPAGYVGRCTTATDGRCALRYTGVAPGTDSLQAFVDTDGDVKVDPGELQVTVSITWVAAGKGTTRVRMDMEGCDGDLVAPINEATWTAAATSTAVGPAAAVQLCVARFNVSDGLTPGPVTLSIVGGPGRFTDVSGLADYGTVVTIDITGGYNSVYLGSTQTGTTTVTAGAAGAFVSGTKPWTASEARSITMSVPESAPSGTTRNASATVRDRFGNGVPGVVVVFTETGAGRFFPDGGANYQSVTDGTGVATAPVATNAGETGVQTVIATISPFSTDCDLAAGDPPGAAAGWCTAQDAIVWGVTAAVLSLDATPDFGVWGTSFRITGTLIAAGIPVGGRTVTLTRRTTGVFSAFRSVRTDSFGRFTIFDKASQNTIYRARFAGDAAYLAAPEAQTAVGVRPGVILNTSAERVARGSVIALSGAVQPAHPGTVVRLQQLTAAGWRSVAAIRLDANSAFVFRVVRGSSASLLYRVVFPSDAHHAWNISMNRRVAWV